ncbi:MAG: ATP-dependent dethiobiotin synthetase BioD [Synechococcales cyanobacterium M58_A2018_015]|nr:ATP-dependent dethiobiotin synthetase BioD [Synechococcales cyanobacterium M58_A2018_015]
MRNGEGAVNALLVTGTDAGVGKTIVVTALIAYWQRYWTSRRLGVMKPIQWTIDAPSRDDGFHFSQWVTDQTTAEISPISLTQPLLPPLALRQEGRTLELEPLWQGFQALVQQRDFVLVEGCGGLGTPLTAETTVADLAWDWRLPAVLVVPVQPGAVTQAVAHVALANQSRLHLKGMILNCIQPCQPREQEEWAPIDLLQSLTHKPVLGCIPHLADPQDASKLVQVASDLELERLISF